jgi:hypothetical protein
MLLQWRYYYYETVQLKQPQYVCIANSILMPPHIRNPDTEVDNMLYRFYIGKQLLLRGYWKIILCANASTLYNKFEYIFYIFWGKYKHPLVLHALQCK